VPDPTRFFVLFAMASLFRLLALPWLRAIREPEERSARYVLSQIRASARPRGWRAMRQLRGQADVATRLNAIRTLLEEKTPLAVEELTAALQDPIPEVRREAARALGAIGDARAVPALIQALHDPASDLVLEAADALGAIGSPDATDALLPLLEAERIEARIAAAQALRRIADPRALPALMQRLERAPGPLEQATLLEAVAAALEHAEPDTLRDTIDPHALHALAGVGTCECAGRRRARAGEPARRPVACVAVAPAPAAGNRASGAGGVGARAGATRQPR
jgi:hypothetical protein